MALMEPVKQAAASAARPMPKSYMSEQEREEHVREGASANTLYLSESEAADNAGDEDTAWAWLALAELSAKSLMGLKRRTSGQFIRDMKLNTAKADAVYGPGWLDRPCTP